MHTEYALLTRSDELHCSEHFLCVGIIIGTYWWMELLYIQARSLLCIDPFLQRFGVRHKLAKVEPALLE